jgi:hypothetical protein
LDSGAYDFKEKRKGNECTRKYLYPLSLYPGIFFLAIASGATPIGSAEHAPDRKYRSSNKDEEATVKELMDTVRVANISTTMKLRPHSRRNIE